MEELYLLLAERGVNIQEISKRLEQLPRNRNSDSSEPKPVSTNKGAEFQEVTRFVNQMKRVEKVRVIKEDELIDMVFNLKAFDAPQRQRFQDKSLEIMGNIRQDFHYKKPKGNSDTKDIASLYLNFFFFSGMKNKVEDLKKVYIDNKLRGLPIVSVLVKWLVEMTRDHFKSLLKDIAQEFEINPLSSQKLDKIGKVISPKTNKILASPQAQKTLRESTEDAPPKEDRAKEKQDQPVAEPKNPKPQVDTVNSSMRLEKRRESAKENTSTLENMVSSYVPLHKTSPYGSINSLATIIKQTAVVSQPSKKKDPIIQVYIRTPNYSKGLLDPLEDLDVTCQSIMTQWMGVHRAGKKLKGKDFVSVDLDRKKDAVSQVYKNLVSRNCDVERTVMNWRYRNHPKKILDASYHNPRAVRKSENFWEDYHPDAMKRFYYETLQNSSATCDVPHKPKATRKKLTPSAAAKLAFNTSPYQTRRPSTSNTLRGSQSNNAITSSIPLAVQIRKEISEPSMNQSQLKQARPETRPTRIADTIDTEHGMLDTKAETPENKEAIEEKGSPEEKGASENHFRILRVTKFLHKVAPQTKKENKAPGKTRKGEKMQNENSVATPNIAKMLERIYTNPVKTNPSDRSISPRNDRQFSVQIMDPYLQRPLHGDDDDSPKERNTSLFTIKGKYSQPNLQTEELKKSLSITEGKEVKSTKNFQEVFGKFSEMLIHRESSKSTVPGVKSLDNDLSSSLGFYARDRSLELEESHKVIVVKHSQPYSLKNGAFLQQHKEGKKEKREDHVNKEEKTESKKLTRLRKFVSPSISQSSKN